MHPRVSVAEAMGWEAGRDGRPHLDSQEPFRAAAQKVCAPQRVTVNLFIVASVGSSEVVTLSVGPK